MNNRETYYSSINVYGKTFKFKLFKNDLISDVIHYQKRFNDPLLFEILKKFLPTGQLNGCLDIGANIGNHTVYFSKMMNFNAIYAFEPQLDVYEVLTENIKLNNCDNVIPYNIGISNTTNETYSISKVFPGNIGATSFAHEPSGDFVFKKIDDMKIENKIDFIKIDVEGMEQQVLEGSFETLKKNKPFVWVECWYWKKDGDSDHRLDSLLKLGYKQVYFDNVCNYFFQ